MDLEVAKFVPHTPPMILIDHVLETDNQKAICRIEISDNSRFCRNGRVPSWFGLEYMAQTIAVHAGYLAKRRSQPIRMGFILGTRKYQTQVDSFCIGEVLDITVQQQYVDEAGLGAYECAISLNETVVAHAICNVYQSKENAF